MGNNTVNLSKLKQEIDSRKNTMKTSVLNEGKPEITLPKDGFLNSLLSSLETGKVNEAARVVKLIENKAAIKDGEVRNELPTNNIKQSQTRSGHNNRINENDFVESNREDLLFEELMKKQNQRFSQQPQQYNGNNLLTEQLYEKVFDKISEQFDSKIIEMYSYERIKNVLFENKDLIKTLVVEVIKELREKSKK